MKYHPHSHIIPDDVLLSSTCMRFTCNIDKFLDRRTTPYSTDDVSICNTNKKVMLDALFNLIVLTSATKAGNKLMWLISVHVCEGKHSLTYYIIGHFFTQNADSAYFVRY